MALILADFVEETTTTTGTGTLSLGGAHGNFRTFVSGVGDGNTTIYAIYASNGEYETGIGTVTAGTPDTLSRDASPITTTGSVLDLPAGTHRVYCTFNANDLDSLPFLQQEDLPASVVWVSTFGNDVMGDGAVLTRFIAPVGGATFPAGLASSRFIAGTAATAETICTIKVDGTQVGSITIAATGTTGTWAAASDIEMAVGEVLTIEAPATADATLADWALTMVGTR